MAEDRGPIVITGAAGLVGQNLIPRLKARGQGPLVAIDKHAANVRTLARLHPDVPVIEADLSVPGKWQDALAGARALVLNHAQISALSEAPFVANNVTATRNVLEAAKAGGVRYIVHISSSVVNSAARDYYVETKKAQEALVVGCSIPSCILRPTLMFGWFDRKHLGWLARFMAHTPVFPVPGDGRYLRQPLYAGDFCEVVAACLERPRAGEAFNISGRERIDFIDLMRAVRQAVGARTAILPIPYGLFRALLTLYAVFDRDPPFTTSQLEALVLPETFEVIDWPAIFGVTATPIAEALSATFQDPVYSKVALEF
jgi:nucleoside-diphosphate-sugar epimerase